MRDNFVSKVPIQFKNLSDFIPIGSVHCVSENLTPSKRLFQQCLSFENILLLLEFEPSAMIVFMNTKLRISFEIFVRFKIIHFVLYNKTRIFAVIINLKRTFL